MNVLRDLYIKVLQGICATYVSKELKRVYHSAFTYTLESVVDIELRNHGDEAKQIDEFHQGLQDEGIPALVFVIQEGVDGIAGQQRIGQPGQVLESDGIVFRSFVFFFGALASVLVGQSWEEVTGAPDHFVL